MTAPDVVDGPALDALLDALRVPQEADEETLWALVERTADSAALRLARSGACLARLRRDARPGEWRAKLTERRIDYRYAKYAMGAARTAATLVGAGGAIDKVPVRHLRELGRIEPAALAAALDDGRLGLDDIEGMTASALAAEVRRLRRENDRLRAAVPGGTAGAGPLLPASVARARGEAAALADEAMHRIGLIRRHAELLLGASDLGEGRTERAANLAEGARPIVLHMASVLASAADAEESVRRMLGQWLPDAAWGEADQPAPLDLERARDLAEWRSIHVREAEGEALLRERRRVESGEVRRGRGRPRKRPDAAPAPARRGRPAAAAERRA